MTMRYAAVRCGVMCMCRMLNSRTFMVSGRCGQHSRAPEMYTLLP